jgi:hypothetical protein
MIVEGGAVMVMVYDHEDNLRSSLSVKPAKAGGYMISGTDPAGGKTIRVKSEGISAFDAARKFCDGSVL